MKGRAWKLGALLFGAFHVVFIALPLLASRGSGESQAFVVALGDFPLVWLLEHVPGGRYVLYDSTPAYVAFFSLIGTLMYAAAGAALGALFGLLARPRGGQAERNRG